MANKKVIMLGNEAIARGAYEAGVKVFHKKFGEGQVTKISTNDKSIHVMFSIGEKRFVYPDAFHMAFLEIN